MTEGNTQRKKHCQNIKSSPGGGKYSSFSLYSGLVLCKSAPWLESGPHRCSSRWQFSGIYRRMKDLITVKAIKIIQWKASPRFGRPIRMSPEPEDDVNRCLLKDERVERGATKKGLHLETLQVTKPVRWIFAQKLHGQKQTDKYDTWEGSQGLKQREENHIYKPQWAVRSEQSWRS